MNEQAKQLISAALFVVLVALLLTNAGCGARDEETELVRIKFLAGRYAGGGAVPLFAAMKEGYFAEEGVEFVITEGSISESATPLIAAGEYEMGSSSAVDAIIGTSRGQPIKSVAVIQQHTALCMIALSSTGIETMKDVEGKRVGVYEGGETAVLWEQLAEMKGADLSKVEKISLAGPTLELLVAHKIDLVPGWVTESIVIEEKAGEPTVVFRFSDYPELNRYNRILLVNDKFAEEHPDAVRGVVKATLKGLAFTIENPEEAVDAFVSEVEGYDEQRDTLMNQVEILTTLWESEDTGEHGLGYSKKERWQKLSRWLLEEAGKLDEEVAVEKAFTNEYLPDPAVFAP